MPGGVSELTVQAGTGGATFTMDSMVGGPATVNLSALGATGNPGAMTSSSSATVSAARSTAGPAAIASTSASPVTPILIVLPVGNGSINGVKGTASGLTSFDNKDNFIGDNGSGSDFGGPNYAGDFSHAVLVLGFASMALAVPGDFSGQLLAGTEGGADNPISLICVGGSVTSTGLIEVGFLQSLTVTGDMSGVLKGFGSDQSTPTIQNVTIDGNFLKPGLIVAPTVNFLHFQHNFGGVFDESSSDNGKISST